MVATYQKEARKRWRTKQREAGRAWACVVYNHGLCHGRLGRLESISKPDDRPVCTCPCHENELLA